MLLARADVGKQCHEQALSGQHALARPHQLLHQTAGGALVDPSPNIAFISIPSVMYIIAPASATALSPGSNSTSTNCSSP